MCAPCAACALCDSHARPQVDLESPELDEVDPDMLRWDDLPEPEDEGDIITYRDDWEAEGRTPLSSLEVGQELKGLIVMQHLYHGAVVDVGAEYDGCARGATAFGAAMCDARLCRVIHVSEPDWIRVRDLLDLDVEVVVRVRAMRDTYRFRFPLELECVTPDVSHLLSRAPPEYPPINVYQGEDETEAAVRFLLNCVHIDAF
jgi:hypothetical protein